MAVATEFTNSYLALAARRQPIAALKAEIEALTDRIEQLSVERDHQLSAITRMAGAEADEQSVWNDMNLRFDRLHRELSAALDQRKSKQAQRTQLEHEFMLEAAQASLRLAKLAVPAYLALRDELHLDIDEAQYRAAAQKNIGEIERHLKNLAQPQGANKAARDKAQPRREPVIKMDEPVHEKRLRMVLKRSG
jgi:chromosome segregation ATPase